MIDLPDSPRAILIEELSNILSSLTDEHLSALEPLMRVLEVASERERYFNAPLNEIGERIVSSDPDGTTYTEKEYFAMLDARVEKANRGEGVLTLEEFKASIESRWKEREAKPKRA